MRKKLFIFQWNVKRTFIKHNIEPLKYKTIIISKLISIFEFHPKNRNSNVSAVEKYRGQWYPTTFSSKVDSAFDIVYLYVCINIYMQPVMVHYQTTWRQNKANYYRRLPLQGSIQVRSQVLLAKTIRVSWLKYIYEAELHCIKNKCKKWSETLLVLKMY